MRKTVYKFRLETKDNEVSGMAFNNNRIYAGLHTKLNNACHEAVNRFNGKLDWQDVYVKFEHEGKHYEQVKSERNCSMCAFEGERCEHPHFDTKPYCDGKIYVESTK